MLDAKRDLIRRDLIRMCDKVAPHKHRIRDPNGLGSKRGDYVMANALAAILIARSLPVRRRTCRLRLRLHLMGAAIAEKLESISCQYEQRYQCEK